ncbi:TRAP transporter small permease subunit [Ferruginivarius sediminum]|uniref:TRAP transporter small permease protein n=1 Tax=Ferruginivarius sediminum TaxID=2661937 RepID=A0A369T7C0_9PROT|nr:TRAP transporter small permease subunit [Ferruginivarius sediminum]RDD61223.1 ABC transporter substrate-binding protein [Ferruginivarius sediminum]
MLDLTFRWIDRVIAGIGRAAALLVLVVIALVVYEIIARGAFNMPSSWAHELSTWLITALIFLGGPYALAKDHFVRVDIFYGQMGSRTRAIVDTTVSTALFLIFVGVLLWLGGELALRSIAIDERSATGAWGGPVWAAKSLLPIGAVLLVLAWLSRLYRLWAGDERDGGSA